MSRPDLRPYFRARIDWHVNGMLARSTYRLPPGVKIEGDVTNTKITATMTDGTVYVWRGGAYSSRKVNGCYAPLMPKPVNP